MRNDLFATISSYMSDKQNQKRRKIDEELTKTSLVEEFQKLKELKDEIEESLATLIANEDTRILLHSIGISSPIMQWAKDKDGRYTYANMALSQHLFGSDNPSDIIGRDDKEIGEIVTFKYPNWTFGSICMGTDNICLQADKPMKFYEWGVIKNDFQYVTAYKNTYKDKDGNILGTCGLAIYVTDEVNALLDILKVTECEVARTMLKEYLKKFGFGCNNTFTNINIENLWEKR